MTIRDPDRHAPTLRRALLGGLSVLLVAGPPARAQGAAEGETGRLLAHAVDLQRQGRLEEAVGEYRRLLARVPESPEARSNLAAALAGLGRLEEAVTEYREALARGGTNPAIRFNLGLAYYKTFRFAEAASELARVVDEEPAHRAARVLLADCRLRAGDAKAAIELLEPLEARGADDKAVAYLLGLAYLREGSELRGRLLLDRILRHGDSAEAHVLMGTARQMAAEYVEARRELERAIALNPDLPGVHALLGRVLMAVGEQAGAAEAFRAELARNPADFPANLHLGVLLRQDLRNDEAMQCFRRALAAKPGAVEVRYQVGALQLAMGDAAGALATLRAVVEEEPSFVEAHVSLATVYYRLRRKADGDRHRRIAQDLSREIQSREPGARPGLGPAYRGETTPPGPAGSPDRAPGEPEAPPLTP